MIHHAIAYSYSVADLREAMTELKNRGHVYSTNDQFMLQVGRAKYTLSHTRVFHQADDFIRKLSSPPSTGKLRTSMGKLIGTVDTATSTRTVRPRNFTPAIEIRARVWSDNNVLADVGVRNAFIRAIEFHEQYVIALAAIERELHAVDMVTSTGRDKHKKYISRLKKLEKQIATMPVGDESKDKKIAERAIKAVEETQQILSSYDFLLASESVTKYERTVEDVKVFKTTRYNDNAKFMKYVLDSAESGEYLYWKLGRRVSTLCGG